MANVTIRGVQVEASIAEITTLLRSLEQEKKPTIKIKPVRNKPKTKKSYAMWTAKENAALVSHIRDKATSATIKRDKVLRARHNRGAIGLRADIYRDILSGDPIRQRKAKNYIGPSTYEWLVTLANE